MLDLVTIIIPPHNRHNHLTRVLDYLSPYEVAIIIADSTKSPYIDVNNLMSDSINYLHLPNTSFTEKINSVLLLVNTPYTLLLAEDDFCVIDNLIRCISFLELNKDYSSCQGSYTKFWYENTNLKTKHTYKLADNRDINLTNGLDRAMMHFGSYFQLFYALHRTYYMKELFDFSFRTGITNMFAIEFLIAAKAIGEGKHKVLPLYFGSREVIANSVGRSEDNFMKFVKHTDYDVQYRAFLNYLDPLYEGMASEVVGCYVDDQSVIKPIYQRLYQKLKYAVQPKISSLDATYSEQQLKIDSYISKYENLINKT